jgi:AraC-like DNA-binding protein
VSAAGLVSVATAAVAIAAAALALAVVLALARRRERRAISALLERLERLEARQADHGAEAVAHLAAVGGSAGTAGTAEEGESSDALTADVLAGMTSRVRRIVASDGAAAETLADQAIFKVQRALNTTITPSQLAGELFVSLRTLERGLAEALGCTPGQLIMAMKMREARRLLESGRHRVAEVADRLGFASPFHFSRRFKAFYRVAPSAVRQTAGRAEG